MGRLGLEFSKSDTALHSNMAGGSSVTLRNRFPATPSSITFSTLATSASFSGNPTLFLPDRDGFAFYSFQEVAALATAYWHGMYTAIA